jgi:hypothetical protein
MSLFLLQQCTDAVRGLTEEAQIYAAFWQRRAIESKAYAEARASAEAAPECSNGHASLARPTERLPARPTSKEGEADDFQFEEAHGQEILQAGIFWMDESGEQQRYHRCLTTNCSNGSYHKLAVECGQCRVQHSGILDRWMEQDF